MSEKCLRSLQEKEYLDSQKEYLDRQKEYLDRQKAALCVFLNFASEAEK
jgi:hypothetical protein